MSRLFFAIPGRKCNWETNWSKGIKSFRNFPRKTRELLLRIALFPRGCCYCTYKYNCFRYCSVLDRWCAACAALQRSILLALRYFSAIVACYFTAIIALLFVGCTVIIALLLGWPTNSNICEEWGRRWGQCSLSLMQHPLQKLMKHKCQTYTITVLHYYITLLHNKKKFFLVYGEI